jgi:tetratricopeptide (TPR) repeat protein
MADTGRLDELKRKFDENPRRYFAPLANEYRKSGEFDRAIELCRAYLPHQPGHMSGYIVYGQALFDAGRGHEAAEIFQQALQLDPENIIALRHLGDIARIEGNKALAMQWYGRVLELDPKSEEITEYVTGLSSPGAPARTPEGPERPIPPTIRPEPTHAEDTVALEDLMAQPDEPQRIEQMFEIVASGESAIEPSITEFLNDRSDAEIGASSSAFEYVPPDAMDAQPEPEYEREPEPEEPVDIGTPFITETMATLYLQQGFTAEALDVYRKLAAMRDEPRLHDKVRELEAQLVVAPTGQTVREFFARIGARKPDVRDVVHAAAAMPADTIVPPAMQHETVSLADRPSLSTGLSALFQSASVDERDVRAAESLSGAFTTRH